MKVLVSFQSCTTLQSHDCSPPGSSVHGILQSRILESGLPFHFPGDLPHPGIKPRSPALQILYHLNQLGSLSEQGRYHLALRELKITWGW